MILPCIDLMDGKVVQLVQGRDKALEGPSPAEMLEISGPDRMEASVHGWFRPALPLAEFLAAYSRAGGTHHLALTYADATADLEAFGRMMGWETVVIR